MPENEFLAPKPAHAFVQGVIPNTLSCDCPRSTREKGELHCHHKLGPKCVAGGHLEIMTYRKNPETSVSKDIPMGAPELLPLWQLDIGELIGHNLESKGREDVNRLLKAGWRLLHIYTLKYQEDGVWRERPMAILGRLREEQEERPLI
jgi:hypothetical protein